MRLYIPLLCSVLFLIPGDVEGEMVYFLSSIKVFKTENKTQVEVLIFKVWSSRQKVHLAVLHIPKEQIAGFLTC